MKSKNELEGFLEKYAGFIARSELCPKSRWPCSRLCDESRESFPTVLSLPLFGVSIDSV